MNKVKKNVVIVGFTESERNSISVPSFSETDSRETLHYIDSLSDAYKYQGYMLIVDNNDNKSIIELDKKYRKVFNKFERILLYNESYDTQNSINSWNKIEKIGRELFVLDVLYFYDEWEEYKNKKENEKVEIIEYNRDKEFKLNRLYNYIKKYNTRKTSEISKNLNINERTIQRYMHDLNGIYHNIGYDFSLNEWYFVW